MIWETADNSIFTVLPSLCRLASPKLSFGKLRKSAYVICNIAQEPP